METDSKRKLIDVALTRAKQLAALLVVSINGFCICAKLSGAVTSSVLSPLGWFKRCSLI